MTSMPVPNTGGRGRRARRGLGLRRGAGGEQQDGQQARRGEAAGDPFLQLRGMPMRTFAPGRATLTSTLRSLSLRPATLS